MDYLKSQLSLGWTSKVKFDAPMSAVLKVAEHLVLKQRNWEIRSIDMVYQYRTEMLEKAITFAINSQLTRLEKLELLVPQRQNEYVGEVSSEFGEVQFSTERNKVIVHDPNPNMATIKVTTFTPKVPPAAVIDIAVTRDQTPAYRDPITVHVMLSPNPEIEPEARQRILVRDIAISSGQIELLSLGDIHSRLHDDWKQVMTLSLVNLLANGRYGLSAETTMVDGEGRPTNEIKISRLRVEYVEGRLILDIEFDVNPFFLSSPKEYRIVFRNLKENRIRKLVSDYRQGKGYNMKDIATTALKFLRGG